MTALRPNRRILPNPTDSPEDKAFRHAYLHCCAAPGCLYWIAKGYTVCQPHWLSLPEDERHTIAAGFRVRVQHPDVYQLAVQRTLQLLGRPS